MGPTVVGRAVQAYGLATECALVGGLALLLVKPALAVKLLAVGASQAVLPAAIMLKKQQSKGAREFESLRQPVRSFTWFAAQLGMWPTCINYWVADRLGLRDYLSLVRTLPSGAKVLSPQPFFLSILRSITLSTHSP